jgi:hypothetical protein
LLIDGRIHKEAEQHRRGAIDGHRYGRARIGQVKAAVKLFGIVEAADRNAGVADLAINVGAVAGVVAIQRNRVERGRKALCRHGLAHVVEAAVCTLRATFAGKHTRRVFAFALEGIDARRIRKLAGHILLETPSQQVAPRFIARHGHLGDLQVRQ